MAARAADRAENYPFWSTTPGKEALRALARIRKDTPKVQPWLSPWKQFIYRNIGVSAVSWFMQNCKLVDAFIWASLPPSSDITPPPTKKGSQCTGKTLKGVEAHQWDPVYPPQSKFLNFSNATVTFKIYCSTSTIQYCTYLWRIFFLAAKVHMIIAI